MEMEIFKKVLLNPDGVANFGDNEAVPRAHIVTIPNLLANSVSSNVQPSRDSKIMNYDFHNSWRILT